MKGKRPYHTTGHRVFGFQPMQQRHFFGWFRRKRRGRPGAMSASRLRKTIEEMGVGKVVELIRIGFDGQIDDMPMIIELIRVDRDGFSGRIVNPERKVIEGQSATRVYAKHGGGVVDFRYTDGDIKDVLVDRDADILSEARDVGAMMQILEALDVNDRILVAYYDDKHRGTLNVEGQLSGKSDDYKAFQMVVDRINGVNLDKKMEKEFQVESDLVIDIAIM